MHGGAGRTGDRRIRRRAGETRRAARLVRVRPSAQQGLAGRRAACYFARDPERGPHTVRSPVTFQPHQTAGPVPYSACRRSRPPDRTPVRPLQCSHPAGRQARTAACRAATLRDRRPGSRPSGLAGCLAGRTLWWCRGLPARADGRADTCELHATAAGIAVPALTPSRIRRWKARVRPPHCDPLQGAVRALGPRWARGSTRRSALGRGRCPMCPHHNAARASRGCGNAPGAGPAPPVTSGGGPAGGSGDRRGRGRPRASPSAAGADPLRRSWPGPGRCCARPG